MGFMWFRKDMYRFYIAIKLQKNLTNTYIIIDSQYS